jgi:hypothetical protein
MKNLAEPFDRRFDPRRKFRVKIEIEWGSAILVGIVQDIGKRGMFIELVPPLWLGATFGARLHLPQVFPVQCTVKRVDPAKGIAVTYTLSSDSDASQLQDLLARMSVE